MSLEATRPADGKTPAYGTRDRTDGNQPSVCASFRNVAAAIVQRSLKEASRTGAMSRAPRFNVNSMSSAT